LLEKGFNFLLFDIILILKSRRSSMSQEFMSWTIVAY